MTDAEAGMMHFEDRGRSHKPRNKWPLEAEKGNKLSSRAPKKEPALLNENF